MCKKKLLQIKMDEQELTVEIEKAILYKYSVELTVQSSVGKISILCSIVQDVFYQQNRQLILLETGIPIPIEQIKSVRPLES